MRFRSIPALVVAVGAISLMTSACGGDDGDAATSPSASAPTTASAVETTLPSTTEAPAPTDPPTTAAPTVAAFPTPTAAGAALFAAWTKSDRTGAGALNLAPPAELDKLFAAAPLPSAKNRGCDDGEFGTASCFFGNDQGGVNVSLAPAPGGWSVATIDPFA